MVAMEELSADGMTEELQAFATAPAVPSMDFQLPLLAGLLAGPVDRLLDDVFREPADYQKDLFALHLWRTSAHDELDAAAKVSFL